MTALKDLLADPEQPISFLVELSYRNPATDAEATLRITDKLIAQGDVPAGYLWGLLGPDEDNPDVGPGGRYVSAEAEEAGGILQATPERIVFSNTPPSIGAAGPLDFLRDVTLSGRFQRVLAGSPTEPIANWEPAGSGFAEDEPEFDLEENTVSLRLKSALGILDQDLDVKSYVGEPSALKTLTSLTQATTATNAAHDLAEFAIGFRVRVTDFGTSAIAVRIAQKPGPPTTTVNYFLSVIGEDGSANEKMIRARYSHTAGAGFIDLFSDTLPLDEWVYGVYAHRSGYTYLMIDGLIVSESASGLVPDTTGGGLVINRREGGTAEMCDVRLLNHYIDPDGARAWMAVLASGNEPGSVGLWRGENTGNTLTDYSATAAHATISGVENTDYEWVSSDLGEPEIAGRSMPGVI